jgi:hypothetical protein
MAGYSSPSADLALGIAVWLVVPTFSVILLGLLAFDIIARRKFSILSVLLLAVALVGFALMVSLFGLPDYSAGVLLLSPSLLIAAILFGWSLRRRLWRLFRLWRGAPRVSPPRLARAVPMTGAMLAPMFLVGLIALVGPPVVGFLNAPPNDITQFVLAAAGFFPGMSRWSLAPIAAMAGLWGVLATGVLLGGRSGRVRRRWIVFYGIVALAGFALLGWAGLGIAVPMLAWG